MANSTSIYHEDPLPILLHRLRNLAEDHNVQDVVKQQIDTCIASYNARENYVESCTTPASEPLEYLFKETEEHPWDKLHSEGKFPIRLSKVMLSGRFEATLLKTLVSMTNAKRVLELGLFTGCGALAMAEALPSDGEVVTCELVPYCQDFARKMFDRSPHGKKVTIKLGRALDTLNALAEEGQKFDFVFMDADKPGYLDYYKVIMDRGMLAPRGTIAVDNALYKGWPYTPPDQQGGLVGTAENGKAIKEFNEFVKQDSRTHKVMVPIRDGLMLVRRNEDVMGKI